MLRMKYLVTLMLVTLLMVSSMAFAAPWISLEYETPITPTSEPVANDGSSATFPDVDTDYWAWGQIEELNAALTSYSDFIVEGYGDGSYQPSWQVTRGQMAVFIARAAGWPTAAVTPSFEDVDEDHWAFEEVELCVLNGVVKGYPDYFGDGLDAYLPTVIVDRAQMAVYIGRAAFGTTSTFYSDAFDDVDGGFWAADWIQECVNNYVVQGYDTDPPTYKPDVKVTRSQMAVFVWRGLVGDVILGGPGVTDEADLTPTAEGDAQLILADTITPTAGPSEVALAAGAVVYVALDGVAVPDGNIVFDIGGEEGDTVAVTNAAARALVDGAGGVPYLVAAYQITAGIASGDYDVTITLPNGAVLDVGTLTVP